MHSLVHQLLLVLSILALGAVGLRLASLAAPRGLERALAAAAISVGIAVAETLGLGLFKIGGSAVALAVAAGLSWLAAWLWLPRPALSPTGELDAWWRTLSRATRMMAGTLAGAVCGFTVWTVAHPVLGYDGGTYHLSEVVSWVQRGSAGSVEPLIVGLPVGYYPATNEAVLAWAAGLSRSFVPVGLWTVATLLLLVGGTWLAMRELRVPRPVAALAVVAFCTGPASLRGLVQVETDFPAIAWLAVTTGLATASWRRPALLAPALVAAGLAVGIKTTTITLAAIALGVAAWRLRHTLRSLAVPLALAIALAGVAGGIWYLRDTIVHGSPLWPLVSGPLGDPLPPFVARVHYSLLERPRATWDAGIIQLYPGTLAGGLVLAAGGVLAPLWARRRDVLVAAAATLLAALSWANSPFTGVGPFRSLAFVATNTLRYALPIFAAGAFSLALSARSGRRAAVIACGALLGALVWSVVRYAQDPFLPSDATLLGVAALGAMLGAGLAAPSWQAAARRARPGLAVAAIAAATLALSAAAPGWVNRHATSGGFDSNLLNWFNTQHPWVHGGAPVALSPLVISTLAGPRLDHRISLVPPDESCARTAQRIREGWVVVGSISHDLFPRLRIESCVAHLRPAFTDPSYRIYGGPSAGGLAGRIG